jgi:hypothetical protein
MFYSASPWGRIHNILFYYNERAYKARVFVPGWLFQPSLMLASMDGAYTSETSSRWLEKTVKKKNNLTYFCQFQVTEKIKCCEYIPWGVKYLDIKIQIF